MTADLFITLWIDKNIIPGDSLYYFHAVVFYLHRIVVEDRHPARDSWERDARQGIRAITAHGRAVYVSGIGGGGINGGPCGRINETSRARRRSRIKIPWQSDLFFPVKFENLEIRTGGIRGSV